MDNASFTLKIKRIEIIGDQLVMEASFSEGAPPKRSGANEHLGMPAYVFGAADGDYLEEGPEAITIQEASTILGCGETTIENMRKDGRLKSYKRGRLVRLRRQQVVEARGWWSVPKGKV